ncbi:flagellar hook-length control protein FliK [Serratia symbiotica]|uniref:flagellar hook-length control protein FliK n=1 Tax=Serratia symbiotica TaxID=138074 RepID=UPI001D1C21E2|nr:flagellar hook-length control protein FliK [Serratia symbiotica]NIG88371.1 flagellar hook-length control protein FliK [Serratia symbiotica]USS96334.1 flagellar hook-length control protein FliK [Serratia symbiotica]
MNLNILPDDIGDLSDMRLPLDQSPLPSGFAQLLSAHFLPNTTLNTDDKQVPPLDTDDKQALVLNHTQLNLLLATFGERDGLLASTSLPGEQASAVQTDGQQPKAEKPAQSSTKSDSQLDNASLQALFAMPPPITASQPATTEPDDAVVTEADSGLSMTSALFAEKSNTPSIEAQQQITASLAKQPLSAENSADHRAQPQVNAERPDLKALKPGTESQQQPTLNHAMMPPVSSPAPAAAPVSALVTAPPTPQLNAQLGSPEWQQALSQQVLMFHRNGQQSAELRLHPQELGALQITLKLDDQQAHLHIASANGQVRAAVEAAMPQLRHALAESGISLGQSSVGGESMPRGQQPQQQAAEGQGRSSYAGHHGESTVVESVSTPEASQRMDNSVGGVNIFA